MAAFWLIVLCLTQFLKSVQLDFLFGFQTIDADVFDYGLALTLDK